jgi:endonuclease-3
MPSPKTSLFLKYFTLAKNKYKKSSKRLAGDSWPHPWQTLIATVLSAQTRDEVTIPAAESLFKRFPSLQAIAKAPQPSILKIIKSVNYNKTKAKNIKAAARHLIRQHQEKIPETIEELIKIPGVGRKTANLVLSEVHKKDAICVDTHCHRLANVLGIVKTKTPHETEIALMNISPKKYWKEINRLFVLWGKEARGRNKRKLLEKLGEPETAAS